MSPATPLLLSTFWSWVAGLSAAGLLGLLLPVTVAFTLGMFVLAVKRRDWREPMQMFIQPGG